MARYANGQIPLRELVAVGPKQYLTPGTAARWATMVADGKRLHGVTLRISKGENGYRSYAGQVEARRYWTDRGKPGNAAYPGTSSHGGVFRGRDAMAIDVGNWAVIGQAKFYALARKHGFEPGFFDWEPWHLIDWNPWSTPKPAGSGGATSKPAIPLVGEEDEEDNMTGRFTYERSADGKTVRVVHGEGYFEEHTDTAIKNTSIDDALGLKAGAWPSMPESYRDLVFNSTLAVRTRDAGKHRQP